MGGSDQRADLEGGITQLSREHAEEACRAGWQHLGHAKDRNAQHREGWKPGKKKERDWLCLTKVAEAHLGLVLHRRCLSMGTKGRDKGADLEGDIDSKWTGERNYDRAELIVFEGVKPEWAYVAVMGRWPKLRVVGWQLGRYVAHPSHWRNAGERRPNGSVAQRPSFFLGHDSMLHDIDLLRQRPGEDPREWLRRYHDIGALCREIGTQVFGIRYNEKGRAIE